MPERGAKLEKAKQLLVEGRDEVLFFQGFLRNLGIVDVQPQSYGGKPNLGNFLEDLVDSVDFDNVVSIGIVRDADESASSALLSVQGRLSSVGLSAPPTYLARSDESPNTSVFIMPDNSRNGALERLCLDALAEDPAMHCVDEYMACIELAGCSIPENFRDKARIHTFLASRQDPELRLGEAAQRGYFDWNLSAFEPLAQFLKDL